jgi:hypothetical protein
MTTLASYLQQLVDIEDTAGDQEIWFSELDLRIQEALKLFESATEKEKNQYHQLFNDWVKTEELKAWYGSPDEGDLFQGTSISSLTLPYKVDRPLPLNHIDELEEQIANAYIELHDQHANTVDNAIAEDISDWLNSGLYYGVVLPSKLMSQVFRLTVPFQDVVFEVDGQQVDPHEILSYPALVREAYFKQCRTKIDCFSDLNITQTEFESSLVLADISKPKIDHYKNQLLLTPIRCNEICCILSNNIARRIREQTQGRINIKSLSVTIYDTDSPYTFHQIEHHLDSPFAPVLPGLVIQGSSGTIDAFRWLYAYRISLISQKMMKGSLHSQVQGSFIPFIFFGVLVPRDANILLDMSKLNLLRYKGNLSPQIEYLYLLSKLKDQLSTKSDFDFQADFISRIQMNYSNKSKEN